MLIFWAFHRCSVTNTLINYNYIQSLIAVVTNYAWYRPSLGKRNQKEDHARKS